jgi:Flp pilus assembly protein TadG
MRSITDVSFEVRLARAGRRHGRVPVRAAQARIGIAAIWVVLTLPVLVLMLVMVLEIGNLWVAQAELAHATEAGALAGANQWGDAGEDSPAARHQARRAAAAFTTANSVVGQLPSVKNHQGIHLGDWNGSVFQPVRGHTEQVPAANRACQVRVSLRIPGLFRVAGPFTIHARATARYQPASGMPQLVFHSDP